MTTRPSAPTAKTKIRFGTAVVSATKPSKSEVQSNVEFSTEALRRAKSTLTRAGVRLYAKKDVPLFSVDAAQPNRIVRKLNGQVEYGIFEDGAFKVTD